MSLRYVEIMAGTFEAFCGIEVSQDLGHSSILTQVFGWSILLSIPSEWVVAKQMSEHDKAHEKRLKESWHMG